MFQQHLNTSRRPDASTRGRRSAVGRGCCSVIIRSGGKGEGSPAQSRGTSRKRVRLPAKLAVLSDLRSPPPPPSLAQTLGTLGKTPPVVVPLGYPADPTLPTDFCMGHPEEGTTVADVPTVKNRAQGTLTHARTAPARDGLQEDEIRKVTIYSLDYCKSRARRRTHQSEEFMARMRMRVCARACVVLECQNPHSTNKPRTYFGWSSHS